MLIDYLKQHKNFVDPDLYQKVLDNHKEVNVVSYKDIPEIKDKVDAVLKYVDILPKRCYQNAIEVALKIEGVNYVEGLYASMGVLPISHGWNSYKGQHFDLTFELHRELDDNPYLSFMECGGTPLQGLILDLGYWGCLTRIHYIGQKSHFPFIGIG